MRRAFLLSALGVLAACADIPRPHRGRPGGLAPRLSVPLAVRIAVPPPPEAMLSDAGARLVAEELASALQAQDVPAAATETPLPLDWRLMVRAEASGGTVRPRLIVTDADGREQGAVSTTPVPTRDWAAEDTATLRAIAAQGAPRVTQILLGIQAARASATPDAIASGPPRLRLIPVRGAPGDGNNALTNRVREFLSSRGYVVQDVAEGANHAVTAEVSVVPGTPGNQRVEIQWIVSRRDGHELGRVLQLNEVRAGSLDRFWGDVAYAASQEAAGGILEIIRNASSPG
ncbi:hypothetical protein [Sabulicella rubraurantiaca]|uniref:hypothetical protein n=1 Tax=Sabulicella rubraurantiaca TaxID=2811429 RepID=UPI001A95F965|nr:hypothetical protein [Sabulicella rubraurantiaca]